ncbi:MAG: hypothetical protein HYU65_06390 [Armatimonadetes bacterium]|nr:hypothetical protein [Armatimonadota bacterium]
MSPEQAVSVGDHVERDIKAAWDAGMQAILLDRFDEYPQFSPRVRNLSELSEWLRLHERQREASSTAVSRDTSRTDTDP